MAKLNSRKSRAVSRGERRDIELGKREKPYKELERDTSAMPRK